MNLKNPNTNLNNQNTSQSSQNMNQNNLNLMNQHQDTQDIHTEISFLTDMSQDKRNLPIDLLSKFQKSLHIQQSKNL